MFFTNSGTRRSGYEIFMDCCCVLYEYKVVKIDELTRKANLGSIWRDQIIDFLLINNYCTLTDNRILSLTKKGEEIANLAPNYKKSHNFYIKNYKGE